MKTKLCRICGTRIDNIFSDTCLPCERDEYLWSISSALVHTVKGYGLEENKKEEEMIYDKRICIRCGKPNGNLLNSLCDKCEGTQFVHNMTNRIINSARVREEEENKMKVEEKKMKQVQVDGKIYDMVFGKELSEHPRRKIAGYIFEPKRETREEAIQRIRDEWADSEMSVVEVITTAMDWEKEHGEKS